MQTPKIVGSRCPRNGNLDPRGKTLVELVAELDDQDVDQIMMQAKAAELDVLQKDVSLNSYTIQATECLMKHTEPSLRWTSKMISRRMFGSLKLRSSLMPPMCISYLAKL